MKHIVLTGGGTAGHVTPNIALIPGLKEMGYKISYIGSYNGIEKNLIEAEGIPYYGISTGKLRRYIDPKNLSDPFRVVKGIFEARKLIKKINPDIVFSKGGFVAVPVVLAAKNCKVPVIIHESDMTPGLANKMYSLCLQGLLQFPGDAIQPAGGQSRCNRNTDPKGTERGKRRARLCIHRSFFGQAGHSRHGRKSRLRKCK